MSRRPHAVAATPDRLAPARARARQPRGRSRRRRLPDAPAAHPVGAAPGARCRRHAHLRRGPPQALDRPDVPRPRAQHGPHRQRPGRDGLRAAGRDLGQARLPRAPGRRHQRRRRLPHERAGARDRRAATHPDRQRHLGGPPLRLDRLEAAAALRGDLRHRLSQPRLREARRVLRPAGVALRVGGGLRAAATSRAGPRRALGHRAAGRLFTGRRDLRRARRGDGDPHMSTETSPTHTTEAERAVLAAVPKQLFIGGDWRDGREGGTVAVEDPATGATIAEVADGTAEDALDALAAAHETSASWRHSAPRDRGDILHRAYEAIVARADELALLMTLEMGKPLAESKAEVTYGASFLRWYAEEAVRIDGRFSMHEAGTGRLLTMKQPVGPCVFITPWNFPLAMGTRKIGPAIAAGCTMVVKPAKLTPLSMLMLAKILEEAGLPAGVLNVVTARSSGSVMQPVITDPRTRKLSFTGSTEVGRALMAQAAEQGLRVSMELGGNAPFVVFEDADLDDALKGAMIAKMRNIGEACTAANRFHVAQPVAAEFAGRLAERMGALKIGRGTEEGVEVGPLIDSD